MSKRTPRLLLEDILESITKINLYTVDISFEEFGGDSKTQDAVIRNFEIIGEAANRLPEEIKDNIHQSTGTGFGAFGTGLSTTTWV